MTWSKTKIRQILEIKTLKTLSWVLKKNQPFFYTKIRMQYYKSDLSVLFGHHVEVWLFITPDRWFRDLVVVMIIQLKVCSFVRNLKPTQKIDFKLLRSVNECDPVTSDLKWMFLTCLVPRAGSRVCCITNKPNSFHGAQDFWISRRSSSVGKNTSITHNTSQMLWRSPSWQFISYSKFKSIRLRLFSGLYKTIVREKNMSINTSF